MTKPYNQDMISRRQDGAIMERACVCVWQLWNQPDNQIHYMGEHNPMVKLQIMKDVVNQYLAH